MERLTHSVRRSAKAACHSPAPLDRLVHPATVAMMVIRAARVDPVDPEKMAMTCSLNLNRICPVLSALVARPDLVDRRVSAVSSVLLVVVVHAAMMVNQDWMETKAIRASWECLVAKVKWDRVEPEETMQLAVTVSKDRKDLLDRLDQKVHLALLARHRTNQDHLDNREDQVLLESLVERGRTVLADLGDHLESPVCPLLIVLLTAESARLWLHR